MKLIARMRSYSCRSSSRNRAKGRPGNPALLHITCRPPKRATAKSTPACTCSRLDTSAFRKPASVTKLGGDSSALLLVDVGNEHLGAFRHEELGHRAADAARPPRNDSHLPRKILCHDVLPRFRRSATRRQTRRVTINGSALMECVATVCRYSTFCAESSTEIRRCVWTSSRAATLISIRAREEPMQR